MHRNLFVISRKSTPEEDAEYLTAVEGSVGDVFKRLVAGGGSPHLINSVKVRPHGDGSQYSAARVTDHYLTSLEVDTDGLQNEYDSATAFDFRFTAGFV